MSTPEIRIDQVSGMRTLLAPGRAERPDAFMVPEREPQGPGECPFCEGHEAETPPEVFANRESGEADGPGWTTRAVPNLYPALGTSEAAGPGLAGAGADTGAFTTAGDPLAASRRVGEANLFVSKPATGAHEVLVNAPGHLTALADLTDEQFEAAVATWRERMRVHAGASYLQLIVNEGAGAGATVDHTHAQLYALPFVPAAIARERERSNSYRERTAGGSLLSDVLVDEVRRRERLVAIDDEAALICPWASRSPFEMRVIPRTPASSFGEAEGGGRMIHRALKALAALFGASPDLNLWVRTAPQGAEHFHWHVDIAPRLTGKAGFELGTGVDINEYAPERAASDLREVIGQG